MADEPTLRIDEEPTTVLRTDHLGSGHGRSAHRKVPGRGKENHRRGRRGLVAVIVVVVLALLVAGAVLGDSVMRSRTESDIATQVAKQIGANPDDVKVKVSGWPFLAVLATDSLEAVDVDAPQAHLRRGDEELTLTDVHVHGQGVRNAREPDLTVIDHVEASGQVFWAELSRLAGAKLSHAGGSRVQFDRQVSVLGAHVTVQVSAEPGLDPADGRLTLTDPKASLDGITIPGSLLGPALDALASRATLPDLGNLKYRSLQVRDSGIGISLSGDDVRLADLESS